MDIRGKKFVMIGGAGLIGSHTVDALRQEDIGEILIYDTCKGRSNTAAGGGPIVRQLLSWEFFCVWIDAGIGCSVRDPGRIRCGLRRFLARKTEPFYFPMRNGCMKHDRGIPEIRDFPHCGCWIIGSRAIFRSLCYWPMELPPLQRPGGEKFSGHDANR